jgi:hypothetical protein
MALYEDDHEYTLFTHANAIESLIKQRNETEGIDFRDLTIEQLSMKLDAHIKKLPNLLKIPYPQNKENLMNVSTDCFCIVALIEYKQLQEKKEKEALS